MPICRFLLFFGNPMVECRSTPQQALVSFPPCLSPWLFSYSILYVRTLSIFLPGPLETGRHRPSPVHDSSVPIGRAIKAFGNERQVNHRKSHGNHCHRVRNFHIHPRHVRLVPREARGKKDIRFRGIQVFATPPVLWISAVELRNTVARIPLTRAHGRAKPWREPHLADLGADDNLHRFA